MAEGRLKINCPECNAHIDADNLFCPSCGHALKDELTRLRNQIERSEQQGRWKVAVQFRLELLRRLDAPSERSAMHHQVGLIYERHLGDPKKAAEQYRCALEIDANQLDIFRRLESVLNAQGEHVAAEKACQAMIRTMTTALGPADKRLQLYCDLAALQLESLNAPERAISTLREALVHFPEEALIHRVMAYAYSLSGELERQGHHTQVVMELDPNAFDAIRQMAQRYIDEAKFDAGWCMCQVLVATGSATPEETQFFQRYVTVAPLELSRLFVLPTGGSSIIRGGLAH